LLKGGWILFLSLYSKQLRKVKVNHEIGFFSGKDAAPCWDIVAGMDGREFPLRDGCIVLELEELSAVVLEPF
jgi:hypothetical protein